MRLSRRTGVDGALADDREASPALTVASSRKGKQTPQLRAEGAAASSVGFQVDQFDFMWLSSFFVDNTLVFE